MPLCRYILSPLSPWSGPPRSDTLYGLILRSVAEREGAKACQALIAAFLENRAPFELSSAVPANTLPAPFLPAPDFETFAKRVADAPGNPVDKFFKYSQKLKKFRKNPWLPLKLWLRRKDDLSAASLFFDEIDAREDEKKGEKKPFSTSAFQPHVSIDRQTGSAKNGQLFFTRLRYFAPDAKFHLYAKTDNPDLLLEYLDLIGDVGFGKDASVGLGRFSAQIDSAFDPHSLEVKNPNAAISLSVCSAPDLSGLRGYYRLETKRGKTGPGYANPFKKPFLMLREGSVLLMPLEDPCVLTDIGEDSRVVQITRPLTLPCRLAEEA